MGSNLLLLADDWTFAELRTSGGLPRGLLVEPADPQDPYVADGQDERIVRLSPGLFVPCEGDDGGAGDLDSDGRDELFTGILGSVLCHVVVLDGAAGRGSPWGNTSGGGGALASLRRWYERFGSESSRRADAKHHQDYVHIVVLVMADEPSVDELEHFQYFAGAPDESKPFRRTYVMSPRLEVGRNRALHASYVWPVYVGRLLNQLMLTKDSLAQVVGAAGSRSLARIWRCYEFRPQCDERLFRQHLERAYEGAHKDLLPGVEDADLNQDRGRIVVDIDRAAADGLPEQFGSLPDKDVDTVPAPWQQWAAGRLAQTVSSPARWEADMLKHGTEMAKTLGTSLLGVSPDAAALDIGALGAAPTAGDDEEQPPPPNQAAMQGTGIRTAWQRVHRNPAYVYAKSRPAPRPDMRPAPEAPEVDPAGGDSASEAGRRTRQRAPTSAEAAAEHATSGTLELWRRVLKLDDDWREAVGDAAECATEMERAGRCYVGWLTRTALGCTALVLVGYFGYHAVRALVQILAGTGFADHPWLVGWAGAIAVAAAALAGAAMAALLSVRTERACGSRAKKRFTAFLGDIDGMVKNRHRTCVGIMSAAAAEWTWLRARSISQNLQALLGRLREIFSRELHPKSAAVRLSGQPDDDEEDDGSDGARLSHAQRDARRRRQRRVLERLTTLEIPAESMSSDFDEHAIRRGTAEQVKRFQRDWQHATRRWDPKHYGRIPVREVLPMVRDYREAIEESVRQEVAKQKLATVGEENLLDWLTGQMDAIEVQNFGYFVSCTVPQGARLHGTLYVQPNWRDRVAARLSGRSVAVLPLRTEYREGTLGFLFEEGIAEFAVIDGHVRVSRVDIA